MQPFKQANNVAVFATSSLQTCANTSTILFYIVITPKGELAFTGQSSEGPRSRITQVPKPERPTEAGASVLGPSSQVQTVRGLELLHPSSSLLLTSQPSQRAMLGGKTPSRCRSCGQLTSGSWTGLPWAKHSLALLCPRSMHQLATHK